MNVTEINEKDFKDTINQKGKVLIDCYAPWCGPCKLLSPIIDELSKEIDDCKFYKLNVDNSENISMEYGIMSIPTILLFENGTLSTKTIGFKNKEELIKIIKK